MKLRCTLCNAGIERDKEFKKMACYNCKKERRRKLSRKHFKKNKLEKLNHSLSTS